MRIKRFTLGPVQSNCYVIDLNNQAMVIDPGYESDILIKYLKQENLDLKIIYITHGHFDHIGGVNQLKAFYPNATVYAPYLDLELLDPDFMIQNVAKVHVDFYMKEESFKELIFQNMVFKVLYTPGHSKGSTALYCDKILFSGDTLFRGSVGRTDFYLGDFEALEQSIKTKFYTLPEDTTVYPGHGFQTTILQEKHTNPFVKM